MPRLKRGMTEENVAPRSRDTNMPESCKTPPGKQRAQGKPGAGCTRSLVCNEGSTRVTHHRFNRDTRPSLRDGVNGVVRALPGVHDLLVTVACGSSPADLAPAQGCQDHAPSQSAVMPLVSRHARVHRIPPRVRDDASAPLAESG